MLRAEVLDLDEGLSGGGATSRKRRDTRVAFTSNARARNRGDADIWRLIIPAATSFLAVTRRLNPKDGRSEESGPHKNPRHR